jgi:1-phosphatidylinositol-3-phosphate 5-kinase
LTGSSIWESKGGKRGHFSKSHDSILVIKTIKDEEFAEFHKFACEYLRHVKNCKAKNGHSLLAKIYGLYEVNIRGNSFKYVVMQNIFFELEGEPFKVYDLKGSEVNRLELPTKGERFTGLDSNFKIDKNYHPYFMQQEVFTNFYAVIEEDIAFL